MTINNLDFHVLNVCLGFLFLHKKGNNNEKNTHQIICINLNHYGKMRRLLPQTGRV